MGNWSQWLFVLGTIIPGVFIMLLAAVWLWQANPLEMLHQAVTDAASANSQQIYVAAKHFRIGYHPFLAGTVLLFAGVEVQGARANLMENPSRDFPEAMILASGLVFVLFVFGSLAVATIIPIKELSLTAGIMQAYKTSLEMFHIGCLVPVALPFSRSAFSAKSSRGLAVQAGRFYRPQRMEKSRTGSRKPTTTERQRSFFSSSSYRISARRILFADGPGQSAGREVLVHGPPGEQHPFRSSATARRSTGRRSGVGEGDTR